jgi:RNA-directed DNA polymerase
VASPLLANLYMRRFLLGWKVLGHEQRLEAHIVNYADDFVILTRERAAEAAAAMRDMMAKLKLTVNERKTRTCSVPDETFTFLGFTFGRRYSWRTGAAYVAPAPATKKVQAFCEQLSAATARRTVWRDEAEQVDQLNAVLRGWANHFRIGYVTAAWRVVQQHACRRLRRWLRRKHGVQRGRGQQYPDPQLDALGLLNLVRDVRRLPLWA